MATDFSRTLSMLRKEQGISQRKVAAALGISQALLSHYENGIRERVWALSSKCAITIMCPPTIFWAARWIGRAPPSPLRICTIPPAEKEMCCADHHRHAAEKAGGQYHQHAV